MDVPRGFPTITLSPREPHTHTVVFLHGRGDNARDFSAALFHSRDSRGRSLIDAMPASFRWVFPQAPTRKCASLPSSWTQWFDVWDVNDFAAKEELQAGGLKEVVPQIRQLLADEAARLGGRWDRVILAGISMGAATGCHVLFNLNIPPESGGRLGAFLGFSCRCPFLGQNLSGMRDVLGLEGDFGDKDKSEVIRNTPILLEHCVDDPLVRIKNGHGMREALTGFGADVKWIEYPSGGHWFHAPNGIDDAVDFLETHVLQNSSNTLPTAE